MTFFDCSIYSTQKDPSKHRESCLILIMDTHNYTRHVIVRSGGCSGGGSSDVSRLGSDAARGELEKEIEIELELGIIASGGW